jgi:hypothetical protein
MVVVSKQTALSWVMSKNNQNVTISLCLLLVCVFESTQALMVPQQRSVMTSSSGVYRPHQHQHHSFTLLANTLDKNDSTDFVEDLYENNEGEGEKEVNGKTKRKTRPVTFLLDEDAPEDDPLKVLERNQFELSMSLGRLKESLQQEQQKSQSLQEKLAQAERIIAQQQQHLEQTTQAQQQELEAIQEQLLASQSEQQKQQQELILKQAKQQAQKEQKQLLQRVQELQDNLTLATYDLKSTNKEVTNVSKELISAQNEINNLSSKLENAVNTERTMKENMQKLQDKLNVARGKLGVKQEVLFSTQRELAQAKAKLELQEKLKEKESSGSTNAGGVIPVFGRPPAPRLSARTRPPAPSPSVSSPPSPTASKKTFTYPLISNWSLNENTGEVTGIVTNHPDIQDGTRIVTSALANTKLASSNAVVVTKSGSKYKLGMPNQNMFKNDVDDDEETETKNNPFSFFGGSGSSQNNASNNIASPSFNRAPPPPPPPVMRRQQEQYQQQLEYPLTGESISNGRGTKYLLAGRPKRKPSGRSEIIMAYKANSALEPVGDVVAVKLSTHKDKLTREFNNYQRIQKSGGGWGGNSGGSEAFVTCFDFLPVLEGSFKYAQHSALVLEKGCEDLREYKAKNGDMDEATIKAALLTAAKCVESLHKSRLVYTDLKAENLISMENDDFPFKGVDLESAIPYRGNPIDYTPEASPPEFAVTYLEGEAYDFNLEYSYDIWSFGMLAYELGAGRSFFAKKQPAQIMKQLGLGFTPPNVDATIENPKLCDLINKCLHMDPKQRLTATQITNHPYFKGEGPQLFGSFGW